MKEELDLLRQIRGLGLQAGRIVLGLDERGNLKVKIMGRDVYDYNLAVEITDTLDPLFVAEKFSNPNDVRAYLRVLYGSLFECMQEGYLSGLANGQPGVTKGQVKLRGYCPRCSTRVSCHPFMLGPATLAEKDVDKPKG
jgi:hypothetical protein